MIKEIKNFKIRIQRHEYTDIHKTRSYTDIFVTDDYDNIICVITKNKRTSKSTIYKDTLDRSIVYILDREPNIAGIAINTSTKNIILQINNRTVCFKQSDKNYQKLVSSFHEE